MLHPRHYYTTIVTQHYHATSQHQYDVSYLRVYIEYNLSDPDHILIIYYFSQFIGAASLSS